MDNSSLTSQNAAPTATTVTQDTGTTVNPPAQDVQPPAQPAGQSAGQSTGWDYKSDPRWGKIWKSETDIIKSYREADNILETKYKPAYKRYEQIVNEIKKFGYDQEKVDDFLNEYKSYKDPNNPIIALGNLLYQWKDTPELEDIDAAFEAAKLKKMKREFPGYTPEQIEEVRRLQSEVTTMRKEQEDRLQAEKDAKFNELKGQFQKEIDAQLLEIEKEAKDLGIEWTDDIRRQVVERGAKTSMEPSLLKYAFRDLIQDYSSKYEAKLKARILEDQQKKHRTVIPLNRKPQGQPVKKDFVQSFVEAFKGKTT